MNSTTDNGGTINNSKVTGPKRNLHFSNRDILNNPQKVNPRTKVHFEVQKRGRRCVAVKINVIDTREEMVNLLDSLHVESQATKLGGSSTPKMQGSPLGLISPTSKENV